MPTFATLDAARRHAAGLLVDSEIIQQPDGRYAVMPIGQAGRRGMLTQGYKVVEQATGRNTAGKAIVAQQRKTLGLDPVKPNYGPGRKGPSTWASPETGTRAGQVTPGSQVTIVRGHNSVKGKTGSVVSIEGNSVTIRLTTGRTVTAPVGSITVTLAQTGAPAASPAAKPAVPTPQDSEAQIAAILAVPQAVVVKYNIARSTRQPGDAIRAELSQAIRAAQRQLFILRDKGLDIATLNKALKAMDNMSDAVNGVWDTRGW
jgi:hypothetical protein